jgi:hypothetical protein
MSDSGCRVQHGLRPRRQGQRPAQRPQVPSLGLTDAFGRYGLDPRVFGKCSSLSLSLTSVLVVPLTCCFRVELRGFEPLTPSMRTRCATGLRYSPENLS